MRTRNSKRDTAYGHAAVLSDIAYEWTVNNAPEEISAILRALRSSEFERREEKRVRLFVATLAKQMIV